MEKKILVIDDDQEILETTASLLTKRHFEVFTAMNSLIAANIIRQEKLDLILLDVLMPGVDGYTFYKKLKLDPKTSDIPVLIITGRGKMEDTFQVMGVDGFITKPLSPQDLIEEVNRIIHLSKERELLNKDKEEQVSGKILAIGNDEKILTQMTQQAETAGYAIETAQISGEAISKAVTFLPDMLFVDVQFKDMASIELVNFLRLLPQCKDKPIIGYYYYAKDDLGDMNVREEILKIHEKSKQLLREDATQYMGRYHDQKFIETIHNCLRVRT